MTLFIRTTLSLFLGAGAVVGCAQGSGMFPGAGAGLSPLHGSAQMSDDWSTRTLPRRAPATDARLYDDMPNIGSAPMSLPENEARPARASDAAPMSLPGVTSGAAPNITPLRVEPLPSTTEVLFASATVGNQARDSAPDAYGGIQPNSGGSQAYVPMLPQDFYAPTNVRVDPQASVVGLPDMEPMGEGQEGFRYLQRRALPVSTAMSGVVLPYPVTNVFSTFSDCRPGGRTHAGLDLGGVGESGGLGTPLYAMARSRVTFVGRPEDDPDRFGHPDLEDGHTHRGPRAMPLRRHDHLPGYGRVNYFTKTYGSWRTGTIIVMQAMEGPLAGHRIRYMHLGAVHPEILVGDYVEAGQEVGVMGGSAVQHDMPHVHIDIEDAQSRRVDVAPFIGLPPDPGSCQRRR